MLSDTTNLPFNLQFYLSNCGVHFMHIYIYKRKNQSIHTDTKRKGHYNIEANIQIEQSCKELIL